VMIRLRHIAVESRMLSGRKFRGKAGSVFGHRTRNRRGFRGKRAPHPRRSRLRDVSFQTPPLRRPATNPAIVSPGIPTLRFRPVLD
jgi:hypothetical protein